MLPLDDPRWRSLNGGYHTPFDAAPRLETLFSAGPTATLWADLSAGLHHQGDVDQASYAAVPHLVDYLARSQQLGFSPVTPAPLNDTSIRSMNTLIIHYNAMRTS